MIRQETGLRMSDSHMFEHQVIPDSSVTRPRVIARLLSQVVVILLWIGISAGDACGTDVRPPNAKNATLTCPPKVQALEAIFQEAIPSDNVLAAVKRAATLPAEERFIRLCDWVLPSHTHSRLRMNGEFLPSSIVDVSERAAAGNRNGGVLVSPVFDLLKTAEELDLLADLRDRVSALQCPDEYQQHAQTAMLALIDLSCDDTEGFDRHVEELFKLTRKAVSLTLHDQWPETLVADMAVNRSSAGQSVVDLLEYLWTQRAKKKIPRNSDVWQTHIFSLLNHCRAVQQPAAGFVGSSGESQWIAVERNRHQTRGSGFPAASWQWSDAGGRHVTGHEDDFLFFRYPLRGSFEVQANVTNRNTVQVMLAGMMVGPTWQLSEVFEGNARHGLRVRKIDPPLTSPKTWMRYRAVCSEDSCHIWLNGRHIKTVSRYAWSDPWVALRSWSRNDGIFQDVRISGTPQIPNSVSLVNPELSGWCTYFGEFFGAESAAWRFESGDNDEGWIVGARAGDLDGTWHENLLRYLRPLDRTGSIEYEFYYSPNGISVSPAIDRLAFLIQPDGVRLHQITDGAYDRTLHAPDHTEKPDGTAAGQKLPLVPGAWNRMKVAVDGSMVRLQLNGRPILNHQLNKTNSRHFGLFHYADQSEVRVRHVVMTGDWPDSLPSTDRQSFADATAAKMDQTRPAGTFRHDFVEDGLEPRFFKVPPPRSGSIRATSNGVVHLVRSTGKWTQSHFSPSFRAGGDFDISAVFDEMTVTDENHNGCELSVGTVGGYHVDLARRQLNSDQERIVVRWREPVGNGEFRLSYNNLTTEATAGTFRIARRGDRIVALFAENDSDEYRVAGEREIEGLREQDAEVQLRGIADRSGTAVVTWKSLAISADRLWHLPDNPSKPQGLLFVMNADGSNLRQITQPIPNIDTQGSPDWSPDGRLIAFDAWTGRAETSQIFLVKDDGEDLRSLGFGTMPTFSPNGQRMAFTWSGHGMATMNRQGQDRKVVSDEGWGAQWSPNGKWIAYESRSRVSNRYCANITIIDIESKQKRLLLQGEQASRYRQIYWNMEWSPDSKRICFKGNLVDGDSEMSVTSVEGSSVEFHTVTDANVQTDFSWHPDGDRILISLPAPGPARYQLYNCEWRTGRISHLAGQPEDQENVSAVWSPDGQRIAFIGRPEPRPVLWEGPDD